MTVLRNEIVNLMKQKGRTDMDGGGQTDRERGGAVRNLARVFEINWAYRMEEVEKKQLNWKRQQIWYSAIRL